MTFFDVYVGDLADPKFKWEGGDWNGNTPKMLIGYFPNTSREEPFRQVQDLIDSSTLPGKQTDWGAWVAIASREKLLELIDDWYGRDPIYLDYNNGVGCDPDLRQQIASLAPGDYALVASEF